MHTSCLAVLRSSSTYTWVAAMQVSLLNLTSHLPLARAAECAQSIGIVWNQRSYCCLSDFRNGNEPNDAREHHR